MLSRKYESWFTANTFGYVHLLSGPHEVGKWSLNQIKTSEVFIPQQQKCHVVRFASDKPKITWLLDYFVICDKITVDKWPQNRSFTHPDKYLKYMCIYLSSEWVMCTNPVHIPPVTKLLFVSGLTTNLSTNPGWYRELMVCSIIVIVFFWAMNCKLLLLFCFWQFLCYCFVTGITSLVEGGAMSKCCVSM